MWAIDAELASNLNSFNTELRGQALAEFIRDIESGKVKVAAPTEHVNLHCHTFYSYNPEQDSPTTIACRAKADGLLACGLVDFDVLDGVEEFLQAGRRLGLRTVAGIETRVFLEEYSDREINSPGEPGIAYHMGAGMPHSSVPPEQERFLAGLKTTAQQRNLTMIAKVNAFTAPVAIDYDKDLLPLTPNGNATERHICLAYARKAAEVFTDTDELRGYWTEKLGDLPADIDLPTGFKLQALIRKKCMKSGGPGYAAPESGSFPSMLEFNRFVQACGGIPALAWLDGSTAGENDLKALLDLEMEMGVAAVNLIPDRNFNSGQKDDKLTRLYEFVETADRCGLPVLAGTELNAPGLKFVDDFDSPELAPLLPVFVKGAHIVYAHTIMQRAGQMGYCSPWAAINFPDLNERSSFYHELGTNMSPKTADKLTLENSLEPNAVLQLTKER